MAHHGGARDFAECTDMRQAGGAVAGLEDQLVFRLLLQARNELARLLERPGMRQLGELAQGARIFGGRRGGHGLVLCRFHHNQNGLIGK